MTVRQTAWMQRLVYTIATWSFMPWNRRSLNSVLISLLCSFIALKSKAYNVIITQYSKLQVFKTSYMIIRSYRERRIEHREKCSSLASMINNQYNIAIDNNRGKPQENLILLTACL